MIVPLPNNVPNKSIDVIVGLLPRGREQLLLTDSKDAVIVTKLNATFPHDNIPPPPLKFTVPPLAVNVVPEFIVKFLATLIVPVGAVNVLVNGLVGVFKVKLFPNEAVVYEVKSKLVLAVVALIVKAPPVTNPEKPDSIPPFWIVNVPVVVVRVPVPLNVPPFSVTVLEIVGLLPNGKEQSLFTVRVPVFVNTTRLKDTLLQLKEFDPPPAKVIVPPLALNIGEPEIDKLRLNVKFSAGALKVPPLIVVAFSVVPLGNVIVPDVSLNVVAENGE